MSSKSNDSGGGEAYGKLTEGLHIAGYTFERVSTNLEWLLEGDRWKLGGRFTDVNVFMDSLRLGQFKQVAEQRKRIVARIKELQPKVTNRQIAKTLGVDESTIRKPAGNPAPDSKKRNQNNRPTDGGAGNPAPAPLSGAEAARTVARAERIKDRQTEVDARVERVAFDAAKLGKFSVLMADPPWDDDFGANRRSTENHYPTMTLEDILALPVADIAHDQSMLFLWATSPMLELALQVVKAWGFIYRTQIIWVKPSIGLGQYVRQRHEVLLVCRRGDHPAPNATSLPNSVIEAPRGEHSAKPEVFFETVERMYPSATKIELFRRGSPREGWSAWGAEAKESLHAVA